MEMARRSSGPEGTRCGVFRLPRAEVSVFGRWKTHRSLKRVERPWSRGWRGEEHGHLPRVASFALMVVHARRWRPKAPGWPPTRDTPWGTTGARGPRSSAGSPDRASVAGKAARCSGAPTYSWRRARAGVAGAWCAALGGAARTRECDESVTGARTPSKTGRTNRASPARGYSARGTVITPTGRSSSAGLRRARVAPQRSGDSSRKRSRGQKGRTRTSSSR